MYVDAFYDKKVDLIKIVERIDGKRVFNEIRPEHSFYYANEHGIDKSIFGDRVTKQIMPSSKALYAEVRKFSGRKTFESDLNPIFKTLEKHYKGVGSPELKKAGLDIEADFCKEKGFARPDDPHLPITAISIHKDWLKETHTWCVPPKTISWEEAQAIVLKFDNCTLCRDDAELLRLFLEEIDDIDVLYTWNGDSYDIPYIVNRIVMVLGKDYTRKLCLWNQFPKERKYREFGTEKLTYELIGRQHLDYLQVYKKFTFEQRQSYKLDSIGEFELGVNKIEYEGSLDHLYNHDFKKYIQYNRQDTDKLLSGLEEKLKFIELINNLAHDNCVTLKVPMGTVSLIDQAIIIEAHDNGVVVPNRKNYNTEVNQIPGGYVQVPKQGLIKWVGSIDINSLYPTVIRCLNMSPETLVAQLLPKMTDKVISQCLLNKKTFADAWNERFTSLEYDEVMAQTDTEIEVFFNREQEIHKLKAKEIYQLIFSPESTLCMSANGTIFDNTQEGIIPGLLARWYNERKEMQAKKKEFSNLFENEIDSNKKEEYKEQRDHWDRSQHIRKITLNSLYGAITNPGSRFSDIRIGQSITLTGRSITKYMNGTVNKILTGVEDYKGDCMVAADTDSAYFTIDPIKEQLKKQGFEISKDSFIKFADIITDQVNDSYKGFAITNFNITPERASLIQCGREVCSISAIFSAKKRYSMLVYDKEGIREDVDNKPGKLKIMGLDIRRSDTPEEVQNFLSEVLMKILSGSAQSEVMEYIQQFRKEFHEMNKWEVGMPKAVNNLSSYRIKMKLLEDPSEAAKMKNKMIPGHVRASLYWNILRDANNDRYSLEIMDGTRVKVCELKKNMFGYTSIAYPVDEPHLPDWFTKLPFNVDAMEAKLIDKKLDNIIGSLNWDLEKSKENNGLHELFGFEN